MRLRASSSSNNAPRAGIAASAAASSSAAMAPRCGLAPPLPGILQVRRSAARRRLLTRVDDVVAPVLGPRVFFVAGVARLLLAEAHSLDLRIAGPVELHHALDRFGAPLPERDVVLAAAALVGVALDGHLRALVRLQVLAVRLDQRLVLVLHVVAVELEIHAALREHVARILERIRRGGAAGNRGAGR